MPDYRLSEDKHAVRIAALAMARVIARKSVAEDPMLAKLDGLGRITAVEDLAQGIVGSIAEEAVAAVRALETYLETLAGKGVSALTAASLGDHAQSAFEDACPEDPSPYEVGLAWRKVGAHLHELLVETAEDGITWLPSAVNGEATP